ncbi:hypothetical protein PFICI_03608 [Pestalotiopsis fici W106-1]|uniref:Endonuclease/exonuclease/phosphatase domain-containing protein n=1 Tax=Pestalotiopsis fici (strain W106-1 / CGMCC3.15140) TaxID=1229662 RepID=W3XHM4_PESFW|nr:uncharacterized protein PFICI_03608 [Pestalotiopsis fici W106-1]ETS85583.1 hypothetical protein PFICI_03608 [Pestalotiopsis fici W106-1]
MATWNPFQTFFARQSPVGDDGPPIQLRVISFNIRYATSSPFPNEKLWPDRAPVLTNQLLHEVRLLETPSPGANVSTAQPLAHGSAFIGLQEVLHNQLVDILAALNRVPDDQRTDEPAQGPLWAHVGVGRDDGATKGEYSPIIYPIQTYDLLHNETIWLSPTPDKPSKGWGAGSIRILTVGVFEHKQTKRRHIAANTHLDNESSESRFESVKIILATLRRVHEQWSQGQPLGVFLTGDFNSFPDQEAYLSLRDDGWLRDLHEEIPPPERYGEDVTFTGFKPEDWQKERGRIDYIWFGPHGSSADTGSSPWSPLGYAILPNVFDNGIYLSDHRAVVGDLRLRGT